LALDPKAPQAPALPQVTVQVTAALPPVALFGNVAAAAKVAAAFTANEVGGGDMNTTAVGPGGVGDGAVSLPEPPQPDAHTIMKTATIRCLMRISSVRVCVLATVFVFLQQR
jgi:hypothetical protein